MMRMILVLTLVAALSLGERTAGAANPPWFQIDVYGTNTYTSAKKPDIDGLSYGHAGTSYFGVKDATGLVVLVEGSGTLTSLNLNNVQEFYSWQSFVKPTTTWALSPQPMPGMRTPDHFFTVKYLNTQYGTRGPHVVIP